MKILSSSIWFAGIMVLAICLWAEHTTFASAKPKYNILFIGNSLTYTNDLPDLVKRTAQDKNVKLSFTMVAKPNYAIEDHWIEFKIQPLIKSEKFDFVIIQQGPSSQAYGKSSLIEYGGMIANLCQQHDTQLAYFMVWPSRTYYQTFDGVINNYTEAAKSTDAILIPVGKVWKDYFDQTSDYSYYSPDGFHPSIKGSQVAAEVILESLGI